MNLTEHFTEKELGVEGAEDRVKENAFHLCSQVLEPVREHFGKAVIVHDGYRSAAHNAEVGGKQASFHLYQDGKAAADFHVDQTPMTAVFKWLCSEEAKTLLFDKAILEHDEDNIPRCVHVQTDRNADARRAAYIGGVGNSFAYQKVDVA